MTRGRKGQCSHCSRTGCSGSWEAGQRTPGSRNHRGVLHDLADSSRLDCQRCLVCMMCCVRGRRGEKRESLWSVPACHIFSLLPFPPSLPPSLLPSPPHSLQGSDIVAGAGTAEEGGTWICVIVPFLTQLTALPPSVVGAVLQEEDHIPYFILSLNDTRLIPRLIPYKG